jgi:hypothetical protein
VASQPQKLLRAKSTAQRGNTAQRGINNVTLIVNEITHDPSDHGKSRIIAAADRRITISGEPPLDHRKLFQIDGLTAAVSYFGIAQAKEYMPALYFESILHDFIESNNDQTISAFAASLKAHLESVVDKSVLVSGVSGLHICGFNGKGVPEFWFLRNSWSMAGLEYHDRRDHYQLSEEISTNQASSLFNTVTGEYSDSFNVWYANGDLQSHQPAWQLLDTFSLMMDRLGLSRAPESPEDFRKRIEWKMRAIGDYYDTVAHKPTVGGDIDTIILQPTI